MPQISAIERIDAPDVALFRTRFEATAKPVVLTRAVAHFGAVRDWSPEFLRRKLGSVEIRYKSSSSGAHPDFAKRTFAEMFARGSGSFASFLDAITGGPREGRCRYLFTGDEQFLLQRRAGQTRVDAGLQPLLDDVELPKYLPEERLYTIWAWFSGPGVRTWLHYDNNGCHNLNAQITGKKRCWLFAPDDLEALAPYPLGGDNPAYNCSQIDVDALDTQRFAGFAELPCLEALLEPGDLLFIPACWFHTFEHLGEFNSNVNFWWKPEVPLLNAVALRQGLIDLASRAGLDLRDDQTRALAARLDEAARRGLP